MAIRLSRMLYIMLIAWTIFLVSWGVVIHISLIAVICKTNQIVFSYPIVPTPDVTITTYRSAAYAGQSATLVCTITINSGADDGVEISALWVTPSGDSINSSRVLFQPATRITSSTYQSILSISMLDLQEDSGTYYCNGTVASLSEYIIGSSAVDTTTLTILGE